MRKALFIITIFIITSGQVFTQEFLAVLPFSGGQEEEGETIADLFLSNSRLNTFFNVIPRTKLSENISREQRFQMESGMTNADTIISIGNQVGAKYVVAGNITAVGNHKLVVISVMNITSLQMIAGDYQNYKNLSEVRKRLPNMVENIMKATLITTHTLPKLVIEPVQLDRGADQRIANTLAQILAINLIKTGKYAMYPRTQSLEQVRDEQSTQLSGITADSHLIRVGYGENPELALSVIARRLEKDTMFIAAILNILTGVSVRPALPVDYQGIDDGIRAMESLAIYLTGTEEEINQRIRYDKRSAFFADETRFWSIGASIGTSFADPWFTGTVHGTIAPFRHSFLEIGLDAGFISGLETIKYYKICPFIHYAYFLPFNNFSWYVGAGGSYTKGVYELPEREIPINIFAVDFITGFNIINIFNISYTLRTNFEAASNKLSVGIIYRFK